MSTSIFIKTYSDDLQWLVYCLKSIRKFASGFSEIVIAADRSCIHKMQKMETGGTRIFPVIEWQNGYIQQQAVKLAADRIVQKESENILFVDSDCVFHTPFNPESFMRDGRPILLKTRYGNLGGAEAWKEITESFVGWPVEFEYMRRLPWMYRKDTLTAFRNSYPNLRKRLKGMQDRSFSEFNALGAFIDRYEQHLYFISDTEQWIPPSVAKQFWSWGGVTYETHQEIEEMLK